MTSLISLIVLRYKIIKCVVSKFNKKELATRFYVDGTECLISAETLYRDKERGNRSQYGILLIHGIELLLKSYLLLKDTTVPDEVESIDSYLRKLGHKYKDIYHKCLLIGQEINNEHLAAHLNALGDSYYEDSVRVRYVQESGIIIFSSDVFGISRMYLVEPIRKLIFTE